MNKQTDRLTDKQKKLMSTIARGRMYLCDHNVACWSFTILYGMIQNILRNLPEIQKIAYYAKFSFLLIKCSSLDKK